ncbi:alpha/beta fold hydrolase [Rubrivivax rivuli]|uniref:Alpha/beta fold hydrolase n=1 Tax=Rubrivivax rivuli TaxID=1862385 RepID=A0A437RII0_9BURK|nr:alpha/beta fold hydrolase [Rubrivivax rivuli]RVU46590.1 alpha/beta fold hydrolase [Rubrivivax rivuli]
MAMWVQRAVGLLLIFSAIALALLRTPDVPASALVGRWAPAPSDFIDIRGQTVHFRDEGPRHDGSAGTPPPLLLIHGTASSLHTWEGWVKALKGQRRVISFDLPGFGLTGPFEGAHERDNYHGDVYARFVLELLDALKVQQVVIAGNSLGGEVAWRTAVMAPQRVAGLVLVDAVGPRFTPEAVPLGFRLARVPVLGRLGEFALSKGLVAEGLHSVYGDPSRVTDALIDRHYDLALREGNRRALGLRVRQMVNGEHEERINTIKAPTLLLWGSRDRLVPPSVGQDFARRIAGSRLVLLDGLGHVPQEEDPARSVAPVKAFLGLPP